MVLNMEPTNTDAGTENLNRQIAHLESSIAHRTKMMPLIKFAGKREMARRQAAHIKQETENLNALKALLN